MDLCAGYLDTGSFELGDNGIMSIGWLKTGWYGVSSQISFQGRQPETESEQKEQATFEIPLYGTTEMLAGFLLPGFLVIRIHHPTPIRLDPAFYAPFQDQGLHISSDLVGIVLQPSSTSGTPSV